MAAIFLLFLGFTEGVMEKYLFDAQTVLANGARCLDGSPSGYYYAQATATVNISNWAIFLEGGGACWTESECKSRTLGPLGSSKYWAQSYVDTKNVLSTDPSVNPAFATWNHVYIPYCGGDCHSGRRNDTEWGFAYFAGYLTVRTVFNDLIQKYKFNQAKYVLLSGESAGGIGTFVHANGLYDLLPNSTVKAEPQAGWFYPNVTYYANWLNGTFVQVPDPSINELWDGYVEPTCAAAYPQNTSLCNSVDVAYNFVYCPLYVSENQFDTNQIFTQLGCPTVGPNTNDYISYFGALMKTSIQQLINNKKKSDGLFLMSCLDHTETTYLSSPTVVQGVKQRDSIDDWFFGSSTVPHVLVDNCVNSQGLPCNPTCPS